MPNGSNTLFVKVVGRHRSCDVVITDDTVSGRHCQITESPDGCIIEDLGSSNGTYVNGKRIESTVLKSGDRVTLGTARFTFVDRQLLLQTSRTSPETPMNLRQPQQET